MILVRPIIASMLVLIVLTSTRLVQGDDEAPANGRRQVILLADTMAKQQNLLLERALAIQLVGLPVDFQTHWVDDFPLRLPEQMKVAATISAPKKPLLVLWCDFKDREQVFLYFTEADRIRILARRITRDQVGDHSRIEVTALIARTGVEALLSGGRIGFTDPAPSQETGPQPIEGTPSAFQPVDDTEYWLGLGLGYALVGYAKEKPLAQMITVSFPYEIDPNWDGVLGYRLTPRIELESRETALEITDHAVDLGIRYNTPIGRFQIGGEVTGFIGFIVWDSEVNSDSLVSKPDSVDFVLGFRGMLRLGWCVNKWLTLQTGPGVTVRLKNHSYVIARAGNERVFLLKPWVSQPFWFIELNLPLF